MAGRVVFDYKCSKGHETEELFPPGTSYDSRSQLLCPTCLAEGHPNDAYLMWASPEKWGKKKSV